MANVPVSCPTELALTCFAAGELDDDALAAVGAHLDECPTCRATLDAAADPFPVAATVVALDPLAAEPGLGRAAELIRLVPAPAAGDTFAPCETAVSPVPARVGRFRVVAVRGAGAMGVVYEADDELLGRRAAVKVLRRAVAADPGARARFLREARATAAVRHPNVVFIHEVGEDEAGPYLVMELLAGESLGARLRREGRLTVAEVVRVGRAVAAGLEAAHAAGLIHRDVTPDNVWLGPDGEVKLLDFGLVRAAADAATTHPGTVVGTPRYMAPEQARAGPVDARADLFGLGAVLYHVATGVPPFPGDDTLTVLATLATYTPPPADRVTAAVPRRLAALLARMMAKDPAARPPTAAAVVADLSAALTPLPRRRWRVALPLAVLAAAGVWLATRPPPVEPAPVLFPAVAALPVIEPPPAAADPVPDDPDRVAATWALGSGGNAAVVFTFQGHLHDISNGMVGSRDTIDVTPDLPPGRFELLHLNMNRNRKISDAGLVALRGLRHITFLQISNAPITNAGLPHLRDCAGTLTELKLHNTTITDAGLVHLDGFTALTKLSLRNTGVTDEGVRRLSAKLPKCRIEWNGGVVGPVTP